ncbi:MAG: tetratricopeptide repeat protein [Bacteroidetes bacterium]|nr:tetratricopeptide repeat protein [Rhodothermia bacterium]MCS7155670.1 tetratricopeptide repeat protein [Bacteroidota bacterium]MCX7906529.1 tetratricopeptide repeat protein [Bacteroidota bacterium]MDW8284940.1 tetratricopeptide repeat protein [Bacteroidota bacterium]
MRTIATIALGAVLLAGCSALRPRAAQTWVDFTAYFNTFYNARAAFSKAERQQRTEHGQPTLHEWLWVYTLTPEAPEVPAAGPSRGASPSDPWSTAIEKAAAVIRDRPRSRFVDDALLLIGRAHFYQAQYGLAEQRFRELLEHFPESPFRQEAFFWRARTLVAMGRLQEARVSLEEELRRLDSRASSAQPRLRVLLGEIYLREDRLEEAFQHLEEAAGALKSARERARARLLCGQVGLRLGRNREADRAFEAVVRSGVDFILIRTAALGRVEALRRSGAPVEALRLLDRMRADAKYLETLAELDFERAYTLEQMGRPQEALSIYRDMLRGAARYSRGQASWMRVRPKVYWRLAILYRDVYRQWALAKAYADSARLGADPRWAEQVGLEREQARLSAYVQLRRDLERSDSLLKVAALPRRAFDSLLEVLRARKLADLRAERLRAQAERRREAFSMASPDPPAWRRSGAVTGAGQESALAAGFLFHKDPALVRAGREAFRARWGDRPYAPNWRRRAVLLASASPNLADEIGSRGLQDDDLESLVRIDTTEVPRDSASWARLRLRRAQSIYELGNLFWFAFGLADSARLYYERVLQENPEKRLADQARFALAELHLARGDSLSARPHYAQLASGSGPLAVRARLRLGMREPLQEPDPERARAFYEQALSLWSAGRFGRSIEAFLEVVDRYPDSEYAPRALWAAAHALRDSALARGEKRVEAFALVMRHPMLERERLRRVRRAFQADSLLWRQKLDSLRAMLSLWEAAPDSEWTDSLRRAREQMKSQAASLEALLRKSALDSARPEGPDTLTMSALLGLILERYPNAPLAERARRALEALAVEASSPEAGVRPARSVMRTQPADRASLPAPSGRPTVPDSLLLDDAPRRLRSPTPRLEPDTARARRDTSRFRRRDA